MNRRYRRRKYHKPIETGPDQEVQAMRILMLAELGEMTAYRKTAEMIVRHKRITIDKGTAKALYALSTIGGIKLDLLSQKEAEELRKRVNEKLNIKELF